MNEADRLEYRHVSGLQLVDFDEVREETPRLTQKLMFEHKIKCPKCDALIVETDPWNSGSLKLPENSGKLS